MIKLGLFVLLSEIIKHTGTHIHTHLIKTLGKAHRYHFFQDEGDFRNYIYLWLKKKLKGHSSLYFNCSLFM